MYVMANAPAAAALTVPAGAAYTAFNVIAGEPGAGTQDNLNLPGSNKLNGQPFTVRAGGYITVAAGTVTTAATPIQVVIHGSNTAAFAAASGNALFSLTAVPVFTYSAATATSFPWEIELELQGDGTSKVVVGVGQGFEGTGPNSAGTSVAVARAAIAQAPSSFNPAAEPPMQFAVAISSAASNNLPVGSTASLTEFQIES
jgi:hypothetical protein